MDRRQFIGVGLLACAGLASSCRSNPVGYQPSPVEQKLTHRVYKGEWKPGFLYQITFSGVGNEMTAMVYVIDSDSARTKYNMPARVVVNGRNVDLKFTKFDRLDKLVYDEAEDRLDGYTIFEGDRTNDLWAKGT